MKKSVIGLVLCMALSVLQGVAQQVGTKDVSGDKEYARVCREYELKSDNSVELLKAYLKQYPSCQSGKVDDCFGLCKRRTLS